MLDCFISIIAYGVKNRSDTIRNLAMEFFVTQVYKNQSAKNQSPIIYDRLGSFSRDQRAVMFTF